MIINFNDKKMKILIDEIDLKNSNIPLLEWISNTSKTLSYIQNLLKSIENFQQELFIKDYSIFTYNYKIFLVTLSVNFGDVS